MTTNDVTMNDVTLNDAGANADIHAAVSDSSACLSGSGNLFSPFESMKRSITYKTNITASGN